MSKKRYPHCSVLLGSRNGRKRETELNKNKIYVYNIMYTLTNVFDPIELYAFELRVAFVMFEEKDNVCYAVVKRCAINAVDIVLAFLKST